MSNTPSIIDVRGISAGYQDRPILNEVSVTIPKGQVTSLIGANGCGKSTLLKTIARVLDPSAGSVIVDGRAIEEHSRKELARLMAVLPQAPAAPEGLSVRELVRFGRHPHRRLLSQASEEDERIVAQSLALAAMTEFADRGIEQLSGGQRQRAWIAMALAQQTPLLLLDEPTTYLDITHQLEVLKLLRRLNTSEGRTIVMVLHDLNQAARFSDYIVALGDGGVVAAGPPREVMTEEIIDEVFGLKCVIVDNPVDGTPLCLPID